MSKFDASEKILDQLVKDITEGETLPFIHPAFIATLGEFRNALNVDKIKFPEGRPYDGIMNWLLLWCGARQTQRRRSSEHMEARVVAFSSLYGKKRAGRYWVFFPRVAAGVDNRSAALTESPYVAYENDADGYWKWHRELMALRIPICYPKIAENKKFNPSLPVSEENKKDFFLGWGWGYVLNVADTNMVEIGQFPALTVEKNDNPRIEELDALLTAYPQKMIHESCIPCYSPTDKAIRMPSLSGFKDSVSYYSTWAHELAHQIGDMKGGLKGSTSRESYSEEELNAELTSIYVIASMGFSNVGDDEWRNSVAYTQHWFKRLKDDPQILMRAASEAKRRGDMILKGRVPAKATRADFPYLPEELKTGTEG